VKSLIDTKFRPQVYIQALGMLVDKHIFRTELTGKRLGLQIKEYYDRINKNEPIFLEKQFDDFLSIQRIVITPTLYLVFPNSKD